MDRVMFPSPILQSPIAQNPILIVEDDQKTAALVALYLEREGFLTVHAADGQQALDFAEKHAPMFVVLDLMLPKVDGWEICQRIRQRSDVPILILTAREEEMDRVHGLSIGADDYVVKPFSPRELVARVKAIIRRTHPEAIRPKAVLSLHGLVLDQEKYRVTVQNIAVSLTPLEFKLLQALMTSPGRVLSRGELLQFLYPGGEAVIDRVIDVHIGKLRQKIEPDPSTPFFILTVRGMGYRFADRDAQQVQA
ncbi:MAG: response regulator transcription factor [bacterium]|nr:response regulator transcription factor [bacterium]